MSIGIQPTEGKSKSQAKSGGSGETDIDRSGKKQNEAGEPKPEEEKQLAQNEKREKPPGEKKSESKNKKSGKAQAKKGQGSGQGEKGESKAAKAQAAKKAGDKAKAGAKPGEKGKAAAEQKAGQKAEKAGEQSGENPEEKNATEEQPPEEQAEQPPNDEIAQKEQELSKEAKALAEKLQRMAGKDTRVGHGAVKKIQEAGEKMGNAASAMSKGETEAAGIHGAQAGAALQTAATMLENAILGRSQRVDVSKEDAPKQYEALISEYFRALSYDK